MRNIHDDARMDFTKRGCVHLPSPAVTLAHSQEGCRIPSCSCSDCSTQSDTEGMLLTDG